ncbi:Pycsar system effector family protein [Mariniphaga sediminis]|uniref:Pycsar system effector family protein n=1 Tax=Mariniphaga sediminis TaxID=1628158 RepID=UPI003564B12E
MKINETMIGDAEKFITSLLERETPDGYAYHMLNHTQDVVKNAVFIGTQEKLPVEEMNILQVAAWFHDVGYLKRYKGHEKESAKIAAKFLERHNVDENICSVVVESILATAFPQKPESRVAKVLCDADFMHLSRENYLEQAEKLRQEQKNAGIRNIKKADFDMESVQLFEAHDWNTIFCKENLDEPKQKNLELLKERIARRNTRAKMKAAKSKSYSRGVDSMFKLTARNQINLSHIADNKSNILISLNGIIISLALATLVSRFKQEPAIVAPTIIFILFSLSTIVLAILSTRPNISSGKFTREDIRQQKVNLLFFGNFYNMDLAEYEWAIDEMINDDPYLYATLTKDQYSLGKVLARKYRLLSWAYSVFMVGLVITVSAFLYVFI